jgi:hypothetical protein
MFKKSVLAPLFSFLGLIILSSLTLAQGTTSRITGVVTDNNGARVQGAAVTLTNEGTGADLTTTTDDSGSFIFDLIQASTYTVTVEKQGFKKFVSKGNQVNLNLPANINVRLEVGEVSAVVTVESTIEQVQTGTSGNIGSTIDQKAVESLPIIGLRGRNPLDLVNFQPGTNVGANAGGGVHVHGSRDRAFNFTLDGIDINEASAGGSNFTPLRPNPDSIQEFQIVTSNFTAELGRSSGAQVTFVTRSGKPEFFGNIFEYYQTPGANANETASNLTGVPRRNFLQHIFGGSVGGPIFNPGFGEGTKPGFLRDKAFFFVNLQMLRASETSRVARTVYTQSARDGFFRYITGSGLRNTPAGATNATVNSSGQPLFPNCSMTVTTNCINSYNVAANPTGIAPDPNLLAEIRAMPLPNDFAVGDGLNIAGFNFLVPQREEQYDFVTRIDYKFSDSNVLYGRYAQGRQQSFGDSVNGGGSAFPGTPILVYTDRLPKNLAINHRFSPSQNTTNEFIFGYSTFTFDFIAPETFPANNYSYLLVTTPLTNVRGNSRTVRTIQFVDNLTWVKGNHLLKGGINFRFGKHTDDRSSVSGTQVEGVVSFSGTFDTAQTAAFGLPTSAAVINTTNDLPRLRQQIADFLGRVGSMSQAFVSNAEGTAFQTAGTRWEFEHFYREFDFYFQDSWKVSSNLLLDLGIRYEVKLSPTSGELPILAPDRLVAFDAPATNTIKWTEGKLFPNDLNNFSPSVGFAWDPFKKGKTSIRANYRLAYDRLNSQVNGAQLFQTAPGNNTGVTLTGLNQVGLGTLLRNPLPTLTPPSTPTAARQPAIFGSGLQTVFDNRSQYPEIQSISASFQQELFGSNLLEVNYLYKRGEHLFGAYNANEANINAQPSGFNSFLAEFNAIRASTAYNSPLINALYTGSAANNAGTATFRSENSGSIANGNVATAAAAVSSRTISGNQMIAVNGFSPFLFVPFPQFGTLRVLDTEDYSRYQALEVNLKRRLKNGLSLQGSWVWSISKDTRSFDPTFTIVSTGTLQSAGSTPFKNSDRSLNYAWSDFDRRHVFNLTFVYELPFGKGKMLASDIPAALDWLIGGWQLSGLGNYSTGRPFTVYSGLNTFTNNVSTPANCNGCPRDLGEVVIENGTTFYFDAAKRAMFSQPAPGEFSNTGRNYFIAPPEFRFDTSLSKKFRITEKMNFELRVDARNVLNSVVYGFGTAVANSSTFGRIRTDILSAARRIQFSGKLNF